MVKVWAAEVFTNHLSSEAKEKLFCESIKAQPVFGNKRRGMEELFVLQTTSQFVVFGVGDSIDPLLNFFIQDPFLFKNAHFYKSSEASLNLLFATASGLCSNVKGGTQVLSDIQRFHYASLQSGGIGLTLDTLIRQSVRVGKKVRASTDLDNLSNVVFESAMDLVMSKVTEANNISVLVIGQGDVARGALEFLAREGMQNVVVAASGAERRAEIAKEFAVNTIEMEEVSPFFLQADLVINEDSSDLLLKSDLLKYSGNSSKKVMLDFGIESDLHTHLRSLPSMTLLTLDDINNSPVANTELFNAIEDAWKLVEREVQLFLPRLNQLKATPVLHSCWSDIVKKGEQEISFLSDGIPKAAPQQIRIINSYNSALLKSKVKTNFDFSWNHNIVTSHTDNEKLKILPWQNMIAVYGKHPN